MKKLSKVLLVISLITVITLTVTKKELKEDKTDSKKLAVFIKQDDGTYKQTTNLPGLGYTLNTSKSTCSNGATPKWDSLSKTLDLSNLTSNNTNCYLYFDTKEITSEDTIARLNINSSYIKEGNPDFTKTATGAETVADNGIYKTSDPMYGGETYYWRGAATTNHVIFANKCWRIIRINGDGSIRLIYNGTPSGTAPNRTCTGNGSNSGSIAVSSQTYNANYNNSAYVGYTHTSGVQRPTPTAEIASNLKTQTDTWFNNNSNFTDAQRAQVADGKYCNDRNTASGYTWSATGSTFYYAGYDKSGAKSASSVTPTLVCDAQDVYTLKAGAIIMDEVIMAGGVNRTTNSYYYLYNGQYYWTMSPLFWNGSYATVFDVCDDGNLNAYRLNGTTPGIRPVINLRNDVLFNSGDGTQNNPYVVEGE